MTSDDFEVGPDARRCGTALRWKRPFPTLRGFTLVELLVVMAIVTILFLVATPNYDSVVVGSRVDKQRYSVATAVALARSEAVKRGEAIRLCLGSSGSGTGCGTTDSGNTRWNAGWRVAIPGATTLQRTETNDARVDVDYSCGDYLEFDGTGARTSSGSSECTFSVTDSATGTTYTSSLRISASGRVRMN